MITSAAVLYLTAHPDDEDAVTLTGLAAAGCRVGLFCLTRGEGGDNQVGSERAELLGARRTAELSGACEHYGVSWLGFSRAYDYGFSRHVDEARRLWDVGQLAEDLSTAIDSFRPDVLVSRFAGLPIDGHAHHQLCGELAVKVANERDLALWVGDLEHPASQSLIGDVASEVRERARAGYLCHRSQRADALWDAFASEPVRYRQVRSGAQGQASPQPRPTPLDGPVALPVARQSPGMYRWRQPRLATCAWMSADPRAPVVQAMPRALLRRPSASQAASRTVRTVERDGRPAVWAHDFGIEVHEPARQVITVATVEPVAEAVGYVPGYGADIEPALDDLCASWTRFDAGLPAQLPPVVLVGSFAYRRHGWLEAATPRLLEHCQRGGLVVVLAQSSPFDPARHAPFPGRLGPEPPEACDQDGPVTLLHPAASLTEPHVLTEQDFRGWIEQRGSKFWSDWDRRYQPLIEVQDPGESPQRGAWLRAEVGAGSFAYCALALDRQLAHGVVGAYRILANALALQSHP